MISHKRIAMIKFLLLVVAVVCMFVSGDEDAQVRCIEREREALLSFKNGLIDESDILSSWQGKECCKWYGVVCSNSTTTTTAHVITLKLGAAVLRGKVGSSLLELHHLNYLDLSFNDFGGNPIPEFISFMKQLRHLYLISSNFSGILPPQIGNLTNLRSLSLSYNSLWSRNLDWLSSLSLLSSLDLIQSDLSHANWLQPILSLHSLQKLYLSYCNITHIVKPFANSSSSTSLSILDLSNNHLTWSSFDWLSNMSTSLVKLDLSYNALNGPIPNTIGILDTLKILDLAYNKLNGSLPHNLGAFSALTELYLGGNNLTGSMPLSLGHLSELRVLDLYNNSLEGRVSQSHFIKLYSLKTLDLSLNSFILDISPDWSPPFQLDRIVLAGCNVGPSFPKWIRTQTNFSYLDLSEAGITDEVPSWLWSASSLLGRLYLNHNQISGTIPDLSSLPISHIDVSYNNFTGPIPLFNALAAQFRGNMFSGSISSLCTIPYYGGYGGLWFLDLSNNQLVGEVPNCWQNMSNLFSLNLANNSFSGEIPPSLGSLHGLVALQLRGNNLSGELPSTMRFCQRLGMLDVGGNELRGAIPSWIGDLYNMRFLNFGRNRLHGSIPLGICNLTHIQILDLSMNNLSGEIPDCFNNFTVLAQSGPDLSLYSNAFVLKNDVSRPTMSPTIYYQYSSFQWKGQEWEYRKNLEFLKLIDLSSNSLTGKIPQSFSTMKGLISLNLSRNSFTGNIIPNIGDMKRLESLDLSLNQLSGKIPTSLEQLHFLAFLDLSNNSLSGRIPTSTQLQSFNASRYAGNDGLCGDPLPKCPRDSLTIPGENMNEKDGIFSFMQEVGISMGFGFIFGFWGVVGSLIVKKSWRNAYFNFLDDAEDWFYVRTTSFVSKWRPS